MKSCGNTRQTYCRDGNHASLGRLRSVYRREWKDVTLLYFADKQKQKGRMWGRGGEEGGEGQIAHTTEVKAISFGPVCDLAIWQVKYCFTAGRPVCWTSLGIQTGFKCGGYPDDNVFSCCQGTQMLFREHSSHTHAKINVFTLHLVKYLSGMYIFPCGSSMCLLRTRCIMYAV